MAKFNKRASINNDISANDFLGKSNLPAKSSDGLDNISVGLSIEDIQDSTKNLIMFKDITAGQLMGVTETDSKRAILLSHLHQWKEQAGWIAGRLLFEIQKKIEQDYNSWAAKGEKEDAKPEYITFKKWIESYSPILGFGVSMANQYIWLYRNVEFDKAELGVKKQKLIQQIKDPVKRDKIESEAIQQKLTVQALQEKIEKFERSEAEKKEKEIKLEKINFQVITDEDEIKIDCNKDDAEYIADAIIKLERQIKLYAENGKAAGPEKNSPAKKAADLRKIAERKKAIALPVSVNSFIKEKIKTEEGVIAVTDKNSKERIKAESRLEAFYEILEISK